MTGGQPVFIYDLGDPECYLAAEAIMGSLPSAPEFLPVSAVALGRPVAAETLTGEAGRRGFEARAAAAGLQPVRWPSPWPPDSRTAMLAATYARKIGRVVAFSLAAFRQAFAGGRDLATADTLLIAGAACEMHPAALLKGLELRAVATALHDGNERARRLGVSALPAIALGDELLCGPDCVERAAETF